jgi:hypothetical protein
MESTNYAAGMAVSSTALAEVVLPGTAGLDLMVPRDWRRKTFVTLKSLKEGKLSRRPSDWNLQPYRLRRQTFERLSEGAGAA